jgi:hypothetical protein
MSKGSRRFASPTGSERAALMGDTLQQVYNWPASQT